GQFRNQATHGLIEVEAGDVKEFTLSGEIPPVIYQALETVSVIIPAIRGRIAVPTSINVTPVEPDERWTLRLTVPSEWSDPRSVHTVARFLVRLLHTQTRFTRHAQKLARPFP
ncbi:MAG TPA: hypothetical protein VGE67_01820, partial [Haloferula sp.]